MKERPIIFSTEMVKAILENKKTETRRVIKPQPIIDENYFEWKQYKIPMSRLLDNLYGLPICPYGKVGDILWVRETYYGLKNPYIYKADDNTKLFESGIYPLKWKPSIFMPYEACRLKLEITEIKVERLQDITSVSATREGYPSLSIEKLIRPEYLDKIKDLPREKKHFAFMTMPEEAWTEERKNQVSPRKWYAELWDSINKKRGYGWETKPFVWVIKFKVV